ncbi:MULTISPECIES: hypothetical protein [unclassified Mesorhizobium]|uniref:hypothetical protein n=1 Tax=unclassified Mesorhizobium TaxID=325217 RepID=UPI000F75787D|nr:MULTISPECIES: hypothetical protein [unclassified Mesorhizobium]AZO22206.1 hypothetical protein EJ070_16955 [Mesorhizobium sp. M1E.F.Ca.ET.045.02.1.1]RUW30374.1 hypothetical protein EOA38_20565 [Mesorhizobium sp. M1E.F.Ca.ET.041.01.1.1]RUW83383.1 hypothetical protein EOA29_13635 [Mesorhizobium sp. M1E.F.Ca.ET.063.01.1.1]RWD87368.1 MAG: hypothetical protein EOS38_18130 [Mesorhizobium sp.]RWD93155.1 MAG: hypothetical protein EOS39_13530 [Mesorhizobium sp.]
MGGCGRPFFFNHFLAAAAAHSFSIIFWRLRPPISFEDRQGGSPFHGNGKPPYLVVLTQFRTENRFTLFLELL